MSTNPYEQARAVYEREPCARTFDDDLRIHLLHGFVFSTPAFFIMGRPVDSEDRPEWIIDPTHTWPRPACDCWHVYLAAGDLTAAWGVMPWPLPWFSFERRNELRFYEASRIQRLSLGSTTHDLPAQLPAQRVS